MHSHSDLKALFLKIKSSVIDMYIFRVGKHVSSFFLYIGSKTPKTMANERMRKRQVKELPGRETLILSPATHQQTDIGLSRVL